MIEPNKNELDSTQLCKYVSVSKTEIQDLNNLAVDWTTSKWILWLVIHLRGVRILAFGTGAIVLLAIGGTQATESWRLLLLIQSMFLSILGFAALM